MAGYYFQPMMAVYSRFVHASTEWLMSTEGRRLIAKAIKLCRNKYGKEEGEHFYNALICVGVIYPQLRSLVAAAYV